MRLFPAVVVVKIRYRADEIRFTALAMRLVVDVVAIDQITAAFVFRGLLTGVLVLRRAFGLAESVSGCCIGCAKIVIPGVIGMRMCRIVAVFFMRVFHNIVCLH